MFKTTRPVLFILAILSLTAVPVFSQTTPPADTESLSKSTCSLDKVPEDYTDNTKWESRVDNPLIGIREIKDSVGNTVEVPLKAWDFRTKDEELYIRLTALQNATKPNEAFSLSYACNDGTDNYRYALRVDGRWLAAKSLNEGIVLTNPKLDSAGKLISVTATLETVDGPKEIVLDLK